MAKAQKSTGNAFDILQKKDSTNSGESAPAKTKQELDSEAAKTKVAAKLAKQEAAEKAKQEREAAKLAKQTATTEARAKAKAEREARQAEMEAQGIKTGPMSALALAVKAGKYVKSITGQLRSTDELATALDGVGPLNVVRTGMALLNEETNKYAALNIGQQSMNYRNRLRGAVKKGTLTVAAIKAYVVENGFDASEEIAKEKAAKADRIAKAKAERDAKANAPKAVKQEPVAA